MFWLCIGICVYAYAGYPLLLGLLARFWPRPRAYPQRLPFVTLLIAAYDEETAIGAKIENSLALDYPRDRLQILIAADGSTDRTVAIAQSYAARGVELSYRPPRNGKMAAIARALPLVGGEVIVLSDANNTYESAALGALVAPFADTRVGATTGAKAIVRGDGSLGDAEGLYWRYEAFIKRQETRIGCCAGVSGEILAIRRELFEVPPEHIVTEDTYMALRLIRRGYRVVYTPQARSWERVSPSAQDEIARRARIFAGRYQTLAHAPRLLPGQPLAAWSVVSHQFARTLIGPAMLGALAANIAAVLRPARSGRAALRRLAAPYNWLALAMQASFYGLAWLSSRAELRGLPGRLLYIPTFLVNSNVAGLIGLRRFLMGRQSTRWQRVARRVD
jgi:cellulose synthase/poly-beta-1,6-N-acetylglucosamine synthase-like glycosyltransferase